MFNLFFCGGWGGVGFTVDELEELGSTGGLGRLALPCALPVTDLVAGDLPILGAGRRGLPAHHDALRGSRTITPLDSSHTHTLSGTIHLHMRSHTHTH